MSKRTCSLDDCDRDQEARGWCGKHYMRWLRHGDPEHVEIIVGDDESRFWEKVDRRDDNECWEWLATTRNGYGRFSVSGTLMEAHRYAYEMLVGPIPDNLTLDHLCRNPGCVNPEHMEPVTLAENILRGESPAAKAARRVRCRHGHEYTFENGRRVCRPCRSANGRRRYLQKVGHDN